MAKEILPISGAAGGLRFANGTTLELPATAAGTAAQLLTAGGRGLRSATLPADIDASAEFERAMASLDIYEQETIHLDLEPSPAGLRGAETAESVVLRPALPAGDDAPRVVLYQDESGGLSWHFATGTTLTEEQRARGRPWLPHSRQADAFVIQLRSAPAREALVAGTPRGSHRGPITKIGRKIFKVLVLPLASRVIEAPVQWIVAPVERRLRHNRIWQLRKRDEEQANAR